LKRAWAIPVLVSVLILGALGLIPVNSAFATTENFQIIVVPLEEEHLFQFLVFHGSDAEFIDLFGSEAVTSGNIAIVGAPFDNDAGSNSGSAYVFELDGTSWTQTAKLTASDAAAGDQFGIYALMSGDIALVGTPPYGDVGTRSISVYVFQFDGTSWIETKMTASEAAASDLYRILVFPLSDKAIVGNLYSPNEIPVLSLPTIEVSTDHTVALCGLDISGYQKIYRRYLDVLRQTTITPPKTATLNVFKINQDGPYTLLNTVSSSGENSCVVIPVPSGYSYVAKLTGETEDLKGFSTKDEFSIHYYSCYSAHYDSEGNFYPMQCIFICKSPEDKVSEFEIILS